MYLEYIEELHNADVAEIIQNLEEINRLNFINIIKDSFDPEILTYLNDSLREELIDVLLVAGYRVILRPHPMSQKKSKKEIAYLNEKFSDNTNFILEEDITSFDSFLQSNIMISDWSGAALEFAFTLERPVLYIDVPKKIHNSDYAKIPHTPLEESIRDKIGVVISKSDVELVPSKIEKLCNNTEIIKEQIKKVRNETVFNIGESAKIGAMRIIELLNQVKENHSEKLD